MNNAFMQYPALSFVNIRGFGNKPVLAQVSLDQKFIVLSTHYLLTPIVAIPGIIDCYVGTQASLADLNKGVYKQLLESIKDVSETNERMNLNDALLIMRAFVYLDAKLNLKKSPDLLVDEAEINEALNSAVECDDLIRNVHHNIGELLKQNKTKTA